MKTVQNDILKQRYSKLESDNGDIFDKCYKFKTAEQVRSLGFYPYFHPIEDTQGPTAIINGKKVIMMGSNNYLGLTHHPKLKEAAIQALKRYGTSGCGSRFLNGTFCLHEQLESEIADFIGKKSVLVFSTGFQTNLGVLSSLLQKDDYAIIDKYDHTSIWDGARLSGANIIKFQHNDASDLEMKLASLPENARKLVVVDGVYSMEGDIVNLPSIAPISKKYSARFMVDDAHGMGFMGQGGRGTSAHFDVSDDVDLIMGTFSKSFASIGGFVAGDFKIIDYIRHFAHSMIFSAALPPVNTAVVLAALDIIRKEPERVDAVRKNSTYFREGLQSIGLDTGQSETPIIPIIIGEEHMTLAFWKYLLEAGVYSNAVLYPAVPKERSMLRTSCMATHDQEHLDRALEIIQSVASSLNFLS